MRPALRKIGALLRDEGQPFPLEEMRRLLGGHGIELCVLEDGTPPPEDLDLVMAMGGDGTALRALTCVRRLRCWPSTTERWAS